MARAIGHREGRDTLALRAGQDTTLAMLLARGRGTPGLRGARRPGLRTGTGAPVMLSVSGARIADALRLTVASPEELAGRAARWVRAAIE